MSSRNPYRNTIEQEAAAIKKTTHDTRPHHADGDVTTFGRYCPPRGRFGLSVRMQGYSVHVCITPENALFLQECLQIQIEAWKLSQADGSSLMSSEDKSVPSDGD